MGDNSRHARDVLLLAMAQALLVILEGIGLDHHVRTKDLAAATKEFVGIVVNG